MRNLIKVFSVIFLLIFTINISAQGAGGLDLKIGENIYLEGEISEMDAEGKEASMREVRRKPFYETTWFITTVSIIAIAGATTGLYFLTQEDPPPENTINW
ncbi:MAG: hypothetical protein R6W70_02280 [bacterium]